jgi:hypothetical protein
MLEAFDIKQIDFKPVADITELKAIKTYEDGMLREIK